MDIEQAVNLYDERRYEEAYELFIDLAIDAKNDEAQYYLGRMYRDGDGVRRDIEKAKYWWKKARRQGNRDAAV